MITRVIISVEGSETTIEAKQEREVRAFSGLSKNLKEKADRMMRISLLLEFFANFPDDPIEKSVNMIIYKQEVRVSGKKEKCYELPGDPKVLIFTTIDHKKK